MESRLDHQAPAVGSGRSPGARPPKHNRWVAGGGLADLFSVRCLSLCLLSLSAVWVRCVRANGYGMDCLTSIFYCSARLIAVARLLLFDSPTRPGCGLLLPYTPLPLSLLNPPSRPPTNKTTTTTTTNSAISLDGHDGAGGAAVDAGGGPAARGALGLPAGEAVLLYVCG